MAYQFTQTGQEIQYLLDEAMQLAEEYDSSVSYAVGDYCSHEGTLYRCTTATTGTWDASKWTDNVIVLNALRTLKGRIDTAESEIDTAQSDISALNQSLTWGNIVTPSATLFNCTGTINGSVSMRYTQNHKYVVVWGRIRIINFSRTGGNPGVTLSLPFTYDRSFPIGYRGESPVEQVNLTFASGRLTTTESYSNVTGNFLTLMVPATIVPLI